MGTNYANAKNSSGGKNNKIINLNYLTPLSEYVLISIIDWEDLQEKSNMVMR